MATLRLRNLRKSYGEVEVIKGVDLDINDRGLRGLRRPVGLRQVDPAADDRRARGDHLGRPDDRRRAGQRRAAGRARARDGVPVLCALSAHDGRATTWASRSASPGPPRPKADKKVQAAANVLQLDALLDRKPGALSGGQRQRVAIGRAIVRDSQGLPVRRAALQSRRRRCGFRCGSSSPGCTTRSMPP